MGEWSKKVGEKGEKIVDYFFKEILGYNSVLTGESIKCIKGEKHKNAKKDRTTHGIDGLISAKSPLEDNILYSQNLLLRLTPIHQNLHLKLILQI